MADLIVTRARVLTLDPAAPTAEAVAVAGRRITFVGSHADAIRLAGPQTRIVDAAGATLLPGLIDSHFHLLLGSLRLDGIQLGAVTEYGGLAAAVRAYAAEHPDDPWLAGYGLRYGTAPNGGELTRNDLDALVSDRPVLLTAFDGHTAWANTRALELGGALSGRDCGPNSEIVIGPDGLALGELREPGAFGPLRALIPKPDTARKRALLRLGLAEAARYGITSVHNMDGDLRLAEFLRVAEADGDLTLRVYLPFDLTPATELDQIGEAVAMRALCDGPLVRAGAVKLFMDGVIEGYTGLLLDPYADRPETSGAANFRPERFQQLVAEADRLGLQIFVHAIGDLAVQRTLDAFEVARRTNGPRDSRHRVEHVELIHPGDLPRFAELGVIAAMQPYHASIPPDYGAIWMARVGEQRWGRSFVWRSLSEAGARLVFGSDWPVVTQDPLVGLYVATSRRAWAPGLPSQAVSLDLALAAYTRDAAYAEFQEQRKGMLRVGMLADLTLFDRDITDEPAALQSARVALTVVDGRIVYE